MTHRPGLCPRCGTELSAQPGASCPRCLLQLALGAGGREAETTELPPEERTPDLGSVGPYRLLSVLGEGGMGTVYLAEQREPIQRRVALKLVRAGLAGKEALARFEAERQALALMTHPGIARVLDAGATVDGAPYFVMDYVQGEPINSYCDNKRLSTGERLSLFGDVCAAVQHAHQRGILHRDLKPSNILVEDVDGEPRPRIIDFGLVKALNQRLTERTLFTERGQIVGTPEYMSPEQAAGEGFDVDTTTDVYSLGVVLYELLTGSLPHDPRKLREAGWLGMMKLLREEEPKKPSTQVSTFNEETASRVAERRSTEPRSLRRSLAGDLDWILLKALDKESARRYPNVSDLAADLERHRTSEPIAARPASALYQLQKLVRRHRLASAFLVTVALLLVAFGVTMGIEARRLARERDRALAAEIKAESEAESSKRVTSVLVDLFRVADPSESRGNTVTAREMLDRGANRVAKELADQPAVQATLQDAVGRVYVGLGLYKEAEPLVRSALATRRRVFGAESIEVARSFYGLGLLEGERRNTDEAVRSARAALAIQLRVLGEQNLETADTLELLGGVVLEGYLTPESRDEAEDLIRKALSIRTQLLGPDHPAVAQSLSDLGAVLSWGKHDFQAGEPYLEQALALRRKLLGESDPAVWESLHGLANHFMRKRDLARAEILYREAVAAGERVFGPDHPKLGFTLNDFGLVASQRGDFEEAARRFARATEIRRKASTESDYYLASYLWNLGKTERSLGRELDAASHLLEAAAVFRAHPGDERYYLARVLDEFGSISVVEARAAEAALREALGLARELSDRDASLAPFVMFHLAELLSARTSTHEALALYEQAATLEEARITLLRQEAAGRQGRDEFAEEILGGCLRAIGRYAEAEPLLLASHRGWLDAAGARSYRTRAARAQLVKLYVAWGKPSEAAKWRGR